MRFYAVVDDRLGEAGYTPLIANTDNVPERERVDLEAMRARQVDGFDDGAHAACLPALRG